MKVARDLAETLAGASGSVSVSVEDSHVHVSGCLYGSDAEEQLELLKKAVQDKYPGHLVSEDVRIMPQHLSVTVDEDCERESISTNNAPEPILDEVNVLFLGFYPTSSISFNEDFKTSKQFHYPRVKKSIDVLNVFAPLALDATGRVIDGNLRLRCAIENDVKTVPVIILDVDERKRDFLRLVLNRSSEFQRWDYDTVDVFVDSNPQLQPVLEPLGFFGQTVLPESFFSNTILNYEVDPFSNRQRDYRQEESLAQWAEDRKREILEAAEERKKSRARKPVTAHAVSLFELSPTADDFLPVYDAKAEVKKNEVAFRELAGKITKNFDAERNAYLEANDLPLQRSRRVSQQVSDDNKKVFIEYIKSFELSSEHEEQLIDATHSPNAKVDSIVSDLMDFCDSEGVDFKTFSEWKKETKK